MNEKLGKLVTDKPGLTVAIIMIITFLLIFINASPETFGLTKYDVESEEQWLPDNDVANANIEINDEYGVQIRYLNIIVQGEKGTVLTPEALVTIIEVERQIMNNSEVREVLFPEPGSVLSLSSTLARNILQNDLASYEEMKAALEGLDAENLNLILNDTMTDPAAAPMVGMFLSKDLSNKTGTWKAKASLILIRLNSEKYDEIEEDKQNPILDADNEIEKILENIIDSRDLSGVEYMGIIEDEYMNQQINEETGGVMGFLFMMVMALIVLILLFTYRSLFDTMISFLALIFAISWMNGIGVILGLTFSAMYEAVPIMLMGLGIDYAIHLVMRYREERIQYGKTIKNALILTTISVGAALFLATITTAVSFGSNTVSEIKPMREFAIFALVGVTSAFIIMVTFVPASKMLYHSWQESSGKLEFRKRKGQVSASGISSETMDNTKGVSGIMLSTLLGKGAVVAEHHAKSVIAGVVIASLLCTFFAFQLETEFDFTEFLPEDAQITDDIIYLVDNFEFGTEESDILIKADGIDDPEILKAMAETEENIQNDKYVNERNPVESILTLMHAVANGEGDVEQDPVFSDMYNNSDSDDDGVPDRDIRKLFNYLMGVEEYRNVTGDTYRNMTIRVLHYENTSGAGRYDGAVIRVAVNSQNGKYNKDISDDLDDDIKPLEKLKDDGKIDKITPTGGPVLFHFVIHSIEVSGLQSLLITVVVAGIILTLVFRITDKSWVLGILTEIPVILVIAWVFASMYFMGMSLNVMTIMISSLTVGLGITYGIHVTHRFVEDLSELDDIDKACRSTVVNTGAALFGAAITTIGGFGILMFAPIPPLQTFGAVSSLAIVFSFIASVFVLPTFLSEWAKYVKKKDPGYFAHHADVKHKMEEHAQSCDEQEDESTTRDKTEEVEKENKPEKEPAGEQGNESATGESREAGAG